LKWDNAHFALHSDSPCRIKWKLVHGGITFNRLFLELTHRGLLLLNLL
jgi:hypothetical protein